MKYTPVFGAPPTVGIELEVLEWEHSRTEKKVINDLVKAGYAPNVYTTKKDHKGVLTYKHQYHCKCENSCGTISKTVIAPVQWKMEYDNTLPPTGAEFISSPFPLTEAFVMQATDAYNIITDKAVWSNLELDNFDGTSKASAGMHVHVGLQKETDFYNVSRVYRLYYPELVALASVSCGLMRGLKYRHGFGPDFDSHHYFLAYSGHSGAKPHFEWRLGEAVYGNPEYFQGIVYLFAALSQAATVETIFKSLEGVGLLRNWDYNVLQPNVQPEHVLEHLSLSRLNALEVVALQCSALSTMPNGLKMVENLFNNVRSGL